MSPRQLQQPHLGKPRGQWIFTTFPSSCCFTALMLFWREVHFILFAGSSTPWTFVCSFDNFWSLRCWFHCCGLDLLHAPNKHHRVVIGVCSNCQYMHLNVPCNFRMHYFVWSEMCSRWHSYRWRLIRCSYYWRCNLGFSVGFVSITISIHSSLVTIFQHIETDRAEWNEELLNEVIRSSRRGLFFAHFLQSCSDGQTNTDFRWPDVYG